MREGIRRVLRSFAQSPEKILRATDPRTVVELLEDRQSLLEILTGLRQVTHTEMHVADFDKSPRFAAALPCLLIEPQRLEVVFERLFVIAQERVGHTERVERGRLGGLVAECFEFLCRLTRISKRILVPRGQKLAIAERAQSQRLAF